ncbi:ATP-binding protein [Arthrobacter sp. NamB2]|uniref:ATP-binding protein n=1 Tax=unclassified Arthrobacter TaxID=235627 RepID=UPI000CE2C88D|nr:MULTISPECIES: ATP-binding protein [unclassified Arthrobacter]TKV26112.1 ATP-binding protein [Arthrobacter sp. NamB2]
MTDILARRTLEEPASDQAIENLHGLLDQLWIDAAFVPELDQMAFTTAVIEAASNVVQHGVPSEGAELLLGVELTVETGRLRAVISEIGAAAHDPAPDVQGTAASAPLDEDALLEDYDESGRGLSMIRALVTTVTVERQGDTNVWVLSRDSDPAN